MKVDLRSYKSLFSNKAITAAVIAICLVFTTAFVYASVKKDITISDIDGAKDISTFKTTVADALKQANIQLRPEDTINVDMAEKLKDGMTIQISRAQNVTIHIDGEDINLLTTAKNVKAAIEEAKVSVGELDRIEPTPDTAISGDTMIRVIRVSEQVVSKVETIDFTNKVIKNDKLDKGIKRVAQKGEDGKKELSIKLIFEDGKEVGRQIIAENIIKQPISGVIEEGTKTTLVTSRGQTRRFTKSMTMVATAYDASYESCGKHPGDPGYGITASGIRVRPGIVAVDPRVIPLGTWLYIEGYGEALAADTGGAIKGNRIDLYYESHKQVTKFGVKRVKVYVLDKPRQKL